MTSPLSRFPRLAFMLFIASVSASALFVACNRDEVAAVKPAPVSDPFVDHYVNMVSEVTATGNSVFFNLEDGTQIENPNRDQITQFIKNLKDRTTGDQFTVELHPVTGSFGNGSVNFLECGTSVFFAGCMTAGNVYVGPAFTCNLNIPCPYISAQLPAIGGCHSPGSCKVVINRLTGPDVCVCAPFAKKVVTPTSGYVGLGQYCCTLTGDCYN